MPKPWEWRRSADGKIRDFGGPWNFSDEALVGELQRAIGVIRECVEEIDRLKAENERMRKQHYEFIHRFGHQESDDNA